MQGSSEPYNDKTWLALPNLTNFGTQVKKVISELLFRRLDPARSNDIKYVNYEDISV